MKKINSILMVGFSFLTLTLASIGGIWDIDSMLFNWCCRISVFILVFVAYFHMGLSGIPNNNPPKVET